MYPQDSSMFFSNMNRIPISVKTLLFVARSTQENFHITQNTYISNTSNSLMVSLFTVQNTVQKHREHIALNRPYILYTRNDHSTRYTRAIYTQYHSTRTHTCATYTQRLFHKNKHTLLHSITFHTDNLPLYTRNNHSTRAHTYAMYTGIIIPRGNTRQLCTRNNHSTWRHTHAIYTQ